MSNAVYEVTRIDSPIESSFGEHVLMTITADRENGLRLFSARLSHTFPYGTVLLLSKNHDSVSHEDIQEGMSRMTDQALLDGKITLKTHAELRERHNLHNTFNAF